MGEEGEGESSSIGLNTVGRKGVGEGERVCGLNELGPLKRLAQVRSVRLVSPTGQTSLAQADRKNLWFGDLSRGLKLMTVIYLI